MVRLTLTLRLCVCRRDVDVLRGYSGGVLDLLKACVASDPLRRPTAHECVNVMAAELEDLCGRTLAS